MTRIYHTPVISRGPHPWVTWPFTVVLFNPVYGHTGVHWEPRETVDTLFHCTWHHPPVEVRRHALSLLTNIFQESPWFSYTMPRPNQLVSVSSPIFSIKQQHPSFDDLNILFTTHEWVMIVILSQTDEM